MDYNVQVLFLHNLTPENEAVTIQNFESFKKNNTDILGICDSDQKGLEHSFFVPIDSYIPRGSRRWSPETVILNYILINKAKLTHSHYMFCEYDCYTECNINNFCKSYKDYDVVAPNIVTYNNEKNWQWFRDIKFDIDKNKLIGFRPSVFILFKKEALIKLALAYQKYWKHIENLNSEVRLGFLSKNMGLSIAEFKDVKTNVNWFETKFIQNNKIYHPVKRNFEDYEKIHFKKIYDKSKVGEWFFGRLGEPNFLGTVSLNSDNSITGYDNFNEKFWEENNDEILFFNQIGGLTTKFRKFKNNIYHGDFYNGQLFNKSKINKESAHILIKLEN
jgi:hypothetical protein